METRKNSNIIAIVGFILSFFIGLAGLICSIIGLVKSKELKDGKAFSIAGIIISSIRIILSIFFFILGILIVLDESKDITNNVRERINDQIEYNIKEKTETNSVQLYANNKNNTITFEYNFKPYFNNIDVEDESNDDYIYSIIYVKVKINGKYVDNVEIPYLYNKTTTYNIDYLTKDNIQVLKGSDKDYFVLFVPEYDEYGYSRTNPKIINDNGDLIYTIEYLSHSDFWVNDKTSKMYGKNKFYIDNDKLYFIKVNDNRINPNSKEPGIDDSLIQEYILTVSNDKVTIEKGNVTYGSGAGSI